MTERRALVHQLLNEHGAAMTTGVISACIHTLPTYMMTDCAEVLYEMLQTNKEVSLGTPTPPPDVTAIPKSAVAFFSPDTPAIHARVRKMYKNECKYVLWSKLTQIFLIWRPIAKSRVSSKLTLAYATARCRLPD